MSITWGLPRFSHFRLVGCIPASDLAGNNISEHIRAKKYLLIEAKLEVLTPFGKYALLKHPQYKNSYIITANEKLTSH